jgi:hypothetical protein
MKDQLELHGESGEEFRFSLYREGRPLFGRSGNFAYVRGEGDRVEVIYVGETDDLAEHAQRRWPGAERSFGSIALYTRLAVTAAQRRRVHVELLRAYAPPMNRDEMREAG